MKQLLKRISLITAISLPLILVAPASLAGAVAASDTPPETDTTTTRLANIKSKGDTEIARRLKVLGTLSAKVNSATKLTALEKTDLKSEITGEYDGLKALRTKLAAETTIAAAAGDVSAMVTEYRVYALVVPKVQLIKAADYQQEVQAKLTTLTAKLQSRINDAGAKGHDVTELQTKLDEMESKMAAAEAISSDVETKVLAIEPTDYNNDHGIVSGYQTQLKTAHTNNAGAVTDAKAIITGLKALK
ncbi:MAG TPA: hypothetical protein VLI54_07010 [Bacillota bacterium]|nr:hypothetical protein [Bacillota bacterium]